VDQQLSVVDGADGPRRATSSRPPGINSTPRPALAFDTRLPAVVGAIRLANETNANPLRMPHQNNLISRFTRMVSAIERTIDQTRHPGMKRTWVRPIPAPELPRQATSP
jgi:hypothetical protein